MSAQGRKLCKTKRKKVRAMSDVFRIECLAFADFQQKEQSWNERVDDFEAKSKVKNAFEVVANEVHTV